MSEATYFLVLFVIAAVFGLWGSVELTRRYRAVHNQLDSRERLILLAFVVESWLITGAAIFYGVLSMRTLLGYERIPQVAPVSVLLAAAIFLIPAGLNLVVRYVAQVPWGES